MRLNEVDFTDARPIDGYGPGFFRIAGELVNGAVLLTRTGISTWGGYTDVAPLLELAGDIDVLFIGTGPETAHLPKDLRARLEDGGVAVEAMASPAAARTYNVLLSEGRRIAVALLPV